MKSICLVTQNNNYLKNGYNNQYREADPPSYEAPETYGAPSYGGGGK